jgi:uracil-DNA glycosylase family 4
MSGNGKAPAIDGDIARLQELNEEIVGCRKCPRLVDHREQIGVVQRRAYRGEEYWCKPITGFGDPKARLVIIGLAPGAHGANRTGRIFTGDRSGDYLYRALFETGFANQPKSVSRLDGLALRDAYITCPVRCVPPDNKPANEEILECRPFLVRELAYLTKVKVVVALGNIGLQAYLSVLQAQGRIKSRSPFRFAHGALFQTHEGGPRLLTSYHPSQQNTSTKRLTAEMLREIFSRSRRLIEDGAAGESACYTDLNVNRFLLKAIEGR